MAGQEDEPARSRNLVVGPWLVEPKLNRISDKTEVHHLEPQVMDLLVFLAQNPGRVISKDEIIDAVWQGRFISEATLTRSVAELRRALGDEVRKPVFLETIPKRGYRMVATVASAASENLVRTDDDAPSILVLPFANLGPGPDDQSFSDGLTEEVINVLTHIPRLRVIGRTTAFAASSVAGSIADLGSRFRVRFVLEGSVRRSGERLRATAQLIRVSDQCHVWSETFDRALSDVFAIQDEIAAAIAGRMRVDVSGPRRADSPPTRDFEDYARYLEGRDHSLQETPQGMLNAKRCYEEALARDPTLALAHDGLAEVYWNMGFIGVQVPKEAFSLALWESVRALEIDDRLAEAHALLAMLHKELDYNWSEVRHEFDRALQLNPYSPIVRLRNALSGLMPHGRIDEASTELEWVAESDPLSVFVRWWLAILHFFSRRAEMVRRDAHQICGIDPAHWSAYHALSMGQWLSGELNASAGSIEKAVELSGRAPWLLGWRGVYLGTAGRIDEAQAALAELLDLSARMYVPPTAVALTYLGLGRVDAAFEWMDRAIEVRDPHIIPIRTYPFFDPIRTDPRFGVLLAKMNLAG